MSETSETSEINARIRDRIRPDARALLDRLFGPTEAEADDGKTEEHEDQ